MKKIYILMMTTVVITLIGAGAVYKFIVQARLQELAEAQAKKEQITSKIQQMEEQFSGTIPPAVIRAWREKAEPWRAAAQNRTAYFNHSEDLFAAKVPEGAIARFYYNEEIRRRVDDLNAFLRQNRTFLQDPYFGVPNEDFYGRGSSPTNEMVETHLNKHAFGADLARMLSRAGMQSITGLAIWPVQTALDGQVGSVKMTISGIAGTMSNQAFIRLIEDLRTKPRYFAVDGIRILNSDLVQRTDDPVVAVEFLLAQTDFEDKQVEVVQAATGTTAAPQTYQNVFNQTGGGLDLGGSNRQSEEEESASWWQTFRRRFIPF